MAGFAVELPTEILKYLDKIYKNSDEIFGGMTKAGAEVVVKNVKNNITFSGDARSKMLAGLHTSRIYKTPSDGGINTKVYFSGYMPFSGKRTTFSRRGKSGGQVYTTKKGVPRAFVGLVREYGHSSNMKKKPFFRKSFKSGEIEKAMYAAQKKLSGGLLDE